MMSYTQPNITSYRVNRAILANLQRRSLKLNSAIENTPNASEEFLSPLL